MRLNKLWFYYLSIAIFFVFLCFFFFLLLAREMIVFGQLGYGKNLPMFRAGSYTGLVLLKQLFTSVSVKVGDIYLHFGEYPQPNILGYCATTDGEERLEITWPSKVFNASFYRGEEVCHINHLPAEGIVIMTQSRWWESHFRILWDAIVSLEYMYKIIINSFTQKLVGLIY